MLNKDIIEKWLPGIAILILMAIVFYTSSYDLKYSIALRGWSPIGFFNHLLYPNNFHHDFPNGVENNSASLSMMFLFYLHKFGLSGLTVTKISLALNIIAMTLIGIFILKAAKPKANYTDLFIVVTLIIASSAIDSDLGGWGQMITPDSPYQVAYLFGVLGIIALINYKVIRSAVYFSLSILCHPILGLIQFASVSLISLIDRKQIKIKHILIAASIFLTVTASWLLTHLPSSSFGAPHMPNSIWIALSQIMNYHWYPVKLGVFSQNSSLRIIPFLTYCILLFHFIFHGAWGANKNRQFFYIFISLLFLTVIGLAFSYTSVPLLIKLALQRASSILLILGVGFIGYGLWRSMLHGKWFQQGLSAYLLFSVFFGSPGFPLFPSLIYILSYYSAGYKLNWQKYFMLTLTTLSVILAITYLYLGYWRTHGVAYFGVGYFNHSIYFPSKYFPYPYFPSNLTQHVILLLLASLIGLCWLYKVDKYFKVAIVLLILFFAANHVLIQRPFQRLSAKAYYNTQLWAKDNTPNAAVFMPPPYMYYGWKDFSQRSSTGNLREWLQNGWMYTSNDKVYKRGLALFNEFGIPLKPYLKIGNLSAGMLLTSKITRKYYNQNQQWFEKMTLKYNIDYFIFNKADMTNSELKQFKSFKSPCLTRYQNEFYVVFSCKDNQEIEKQIKLQ